jgi:hypothetical protein
LAAGTTDQTRLWRNLHPYAHAVWTFAANRLREGDSRCYSRAQAAADAYLDYFRRFVDLAAAHDIEVIIYEFPWPMRQVWVLR